MALCPLNVTLRCKECTFYAKDKEICLFLLAVEVLQDIQGELVILNQRLDPRQ